MTRTRRTGRGLAVSLLILATGLVLLGRDVYLEAKARLAEHLIARAFTVHLETGRPQPPWSWADFHPIGKIDVERLKVTRYILSDATGASMAFGLGHIAGTRPPNQPGQSAAAGHRDSWARFLQDVRLGDTVVLTTHDGIYRYRVKTLDIVHRTDTWILDPTSAHREDQRLSLITCYPFDAWGETGLRYAVSCTVRPESASATRAGHAASRSPLDSVPAHDLEKAGVIRQAEFFRGVRDVPVVAP